MEIFDTSSLAGKMEVKIYGSAVLRKEAKPIKEITPEIKELAERMIKCMYDEEGIGLAAPQIGESIRMFVIDTRIDEKPNYKTPGEAFLSPLMPLAIVNPEIVSTSGGLCPYNEGCLSIPGVHANVMRPQIIRLRGTLLNGTQIDTECGGLLARCAQHEIDHLNGVLFTDIADKEDLIEYEEKLVTMDKKNRSNSHSKKK